MNSTNRRRLILLALVAAIVLPVEFLALSNLSHQDRLLEDIWADQLAQADRQAAAMNLQHFPPSYRGALLRRLSAEDQASAWRQAAVAYTEQHHELTAVQRGILEQWSAALTASEFAPDASVSPTRRRLALAIQTELGDDAYRYLVRDAGPIDRTPAYLVSALPLRVRLDALMRSYFLVIADDVPCDCIPGFLDCEKTQNCQYDKNCKVGEKKNCGVNKQEPCNSKCHPNPEGK
jgi:hypothetical protein